MKQQTNQTKNKTTKKHKNSKKKQTNPNIKKSKQK